MVLVTRQRKECIQFLQRREEEIHLPHTLDHRIKVNEEASDDDLDRHELAERQLPGGEEPAAKARAPLCARACPPTEARN